MNFVTLCAKEMNPNWTITAHRLVNCLFSAQSASFSYSFAFRRTYSVSWPMTLHSRWLWIVHFASNTCAAEPLSTCAGSIFSSFISCCFRSVLLLLHLRLLLLLFVILFCAASARARQCVCVSAVAILLSVARSVQNAMSTGRDANIKMHKYD